MTGKPDPAAARALCDEMAKLAEETMKGALQAVVPRYLLEAVPAIISHVRALADEVERLRGNVECYENKKWAEIELALADNEAMALWQGLHGKVDDVLKRAELAEADCEELMRVAREVWNDPDPYRREALATLPAALLAKVKGGEG